MSLLATSQDFSMNVEPPKRSGCNWKLFFLFVIACSCLALVIMAIAAAVVLYPLLPYMKFAPTVLENYLAVTDLLIGANVTTVAEDVQKFYESTRLILGSLNSILRNDTAVQDFAENSVEVVKFGLLMVRKTLFNAYSLCLVLIIYIRKRFTILTMVFFFYTGCS